MRNARIIVLIAVLLISLMCANSVVGDMPELECIARSFIHADNSEAQFEMTAKRDLLALMTAYPEYVTGVETDGSLIYLAMKSGARILYDDGREKSYEQALAAPDVQDTMEMLYPAQHISMLAEGNFDPGRIRSYELLKEVYGGGREAIERNLSSVQLGPGVCLFSKCAGASKAIEQVFRGIEDICEQDGSVYAFVYPLNGTYNYRVIAGTDRLSPHAFGIAIDLSSDAGDYWRWAAKELGQKRLESYPEALVRAFEDNGFIWGGKWAHFDILHFEYRPEIIIKSRYHKEPQRGEPWHSGFPDTEQTRKFIGIIDDALG